jgi:hypothetical protein
MRALLGEKRELAQKLASLEKELKQRINENGAGLVGLPDCIG